MTESNWVEGAAAWAIVREMSAGDIVEFDKESWRDGVGFMMVDDWSHLSADDVLDEIEKIIGEYGDTLGGAMIYDEARRERAMAAGYDDPAEYEFRYGR